MTRKRTLYLAASVLLALSYALAPPQGESCGACAIPGDRSVKCQRTSAGATTGFTYRIFLTHSPWLPSARIATVHRGPSVDSLVCEPRVLRLMSKYGGETQIVLSELPGLLLRPLRISEGTQSHDIRGFSPQDASLIASFGLFAWAFALVIAEAARQRGQR